MRPIGLAVAIATAAGTTRAAMTGAGVRGRRRQGFRFGENGVDAPLLVGVQHEQLPGVRPRLAEKLEPGASLILDEDLIEHQLPPRFVLTAEPPAIARRAPPVAPPVVAAEAGH